MSALGWALVAIGSLAILIKSGVLWWLVKATTALVGLIILLGALAVAALFLLNGIMPVTP